MVRIQTEIHTEDLFGHIVVYGWHSHYKLVLNELRGEGLYTHHSILIINTNDKINLEGLGSNVYTLNSTGNYEEDLLAANVKGADSLIISSMGRDWESPKSSDAKAILICLLAKKMQPKVRVIVDIPFGNNVEHLLNAGVDEVICGEEFCSMLTASAVLNEGITSFFREILSTQYGNEFYCVPFRDSRFHGMTYVNAMEELKEKKNVLLLAIMRRKHILANPQFLSIEPDDIGIVLAEVNIEHF